MDEPKPDSAPAESATEASLRRLHDAGVLSDADFEARMREARSRPGGAPIGSPARMQPPAGTSEAASPPPPPVSAASDPAGRWVCLRCFAANDDSDAVCSTCGLARGASAGPVSPRPTSRGLRLGWVVRRFGWLIVVAIFAAGGALFAAGRNDAGQITKGGNLAIEDVRVGDCFNMKDVNEKTTGDVDAKQCSEPHQFEMMFTGQMRDGDYPSDSEVTDFVASSCGPAFTDYVGVPYANSTLEVFYWHPESAGWSKGDRAIQCAVFDPKDDALVGTLKGSKR